MSESERMAVLRSSMAGASIIVRGSQPCLAAVGIWLSITLPVAEFMSTSLSPHTYSAPPGVLSIQGQAGTRPCR